MLNDDEATAVLGRAGDLHEPATGLRTSDAASAWMNDVYRYALGRLGSPEDAEDATMEVFLAAHSALAGARKMRDPRLYLFGIAARKIANVLRRRYRERPIAAATPEREDAERRQSIEAVLGRLPEAQRDVLILKYLHEFSVQEIAQIVRKSPQAVNSLLQRARDGFRAEADEDFVEGMSR
jgi:RNA polymerase sigma-70 factor, ECF subfamily